MTTPHADVVIIGGGIAGLACATHLHRSGASFLLLEASGRLGGRLRTDRVEGFLLDRGFQVLLTSYPDAQRLLDLEALDLHELYPGALVWAEGRLHRVADPFRRPLDAIAAARSPIAGWRDYRALARLRARTKVTSNEQLLARRETSALETLRECGLSERITERFFRPFLAGVFLDPQLETSSRMLDFVLRMFATGFAALPAGGMESIPAQLAEGLPGSALRLHGRVETVEGTSLTPCGRAHRDAGGGRRHRRPGSRPPALRASARAGAARDDLPLLRRVDGTGQGPPDRPRRRAQRPRQQPLCRERGGALVRSSRRRSRVGLRSGSPRARRRAARAGRPCAAFDVVRQRGRELATPAHLPDPGGAAVRRRLPRSSLPIEPCGSRPGSSSAAIIAIRRRFRERSHRADAQPRQPSRRYAAPVRVWPVPARPAELTPRSPRQAQARLDGDDHDPAPAQGLSQHVHPGAPAHTP